MTREADDVLMAQAVDFRIRLDSGRATPADHRACDAWRGGSEAHERAWQAVEQRWNACTEALRTAARQLPDHNDAVKEILTLPNRSRRMALAAVATTLGAAAAAALGERRMPIASLAADYATGTGERRTWRLADGSSLMLDARSSADVRIGAEHRQLTLCGGQASLDIVPGVGRFTAATGQCMVEAPAQASRLFALRRTPRRTLVVAARGDVAVDAGGGARLMLAQGQGCWVEEGRISMLDASQANAELAWRSGRLEVLDQPLAAVVDALRKYRVGYIRLDPDAARMRVQSVLPLDDTDLALDSLAQALPLAIERYGSWLAIVRLREEKRNKT